MYDEVTTSRRWQQLTATLYAQRRFSTIKLGLDAMSRALTLSGFDSSRLPHRVILVAGTNGKGTTASCLASFLHVQGLRVGLYTSPHIVEFDERFRIDGHVAHRASILEIGERILHVFGQAESDPSLTFFELTTLIAVELFVQQHVDVGIYEVGLGGRLDATNALHPDLCILTSVGYDHQRYLGHTLLEILTEKLGIARPGVPLFVGHQDHEEVNQLLSAHTHEPLYRYGCHFGVYQDTSEDQPSLWRTERDEIHRVNVTRWGAFTTPYQRAHVSTAFAVAHHIRRHWTKTLSEEAMNDPDVDIVGSIQWPGRMQRVTVPPDYVRLFCKEGRGPVHVELLCDAAHNEDGARALFRALSKDDEPVDAVLCSFLEDKPIEDMLRHLMSWMHRTHRPPLIYASVLQNERASSAAVMSEACRAVDCTLTAPPTLLEHVLATLFEDMLSAPARDSYRILVFGSIYLLGELWSVLDLSSHAKRPLCMH